MQTADSANAPVQSVNRFRRVAFTSNGGLLVKFHLLLSELGLEVRAELLSLALEYKDGSDARARTESPARWQAIWIRVASLLETPPLPQP